ncbi:MAG: hypothetical protein RL264_219 [Bacteroidota bacterium]|jgi:hypothetical protein
MNEELLQKAMQLFDSAEKWNSFIELVNKNNEIQSRWWKKLQLEVFDREQKNGNSEWDIIIWYNWDIRWFIKGEPNNTICIHFWGDGFRVFYNWGGLDIEKVNELIKDPRFDKIKSCMDRIEGSDNVTICWENRNFGFDTPYDFCFPNSQTLSWYAGNETMKFADQLIAKVRKFQTPEITQLFKEINEKCKK